MSELGIKIVEYNEETDEVISEVDEEAKGQRESDDGSCYEFRFDGHISCAIVLFRFLMEFLGETDISDFRNLSCSNSV